MILLMDYLLYLINSHLKWVKCYKKLNNVYLKQVLDNMMFIIHLIKIKMVYIIVYILGYISHDDIKKKL